MFSQSGADARDAMKGLIVFALVAGGERRWFKRA